MPKILIGCGVAALLALLALGVGLYYLYRTGMQWAQAGQQMIEAYDATNRRFAFEPPETNSIGAERLERWLAVREALLPYAGEFDRWMDEDHPVNPFAMLGSLLDRAGRFVEAHVAALEAQRMSLDEYNWIMRRVYTALTSGDAMADESFAQIAAELDRVARQSPEAAMRVPMTSESIADTLEALHGRLDRFKEMRPLFEADFFMIQMLGDMPRMLDPQPPGASPPDDSAASAPALTWPSPAGRRLCMAS